MKKMLSLILCLCMILSVMSAIPASAGGYFATAVYLDSYPALGKNPPRVYTDKSDMEITVSEWSGNFDSNGCFIGGEDYSLTVEYTIKEKNRKNSEFDTNPGVLKFEFSVLGNYNRYYADIMELSQYKVKGKYTFHVDSGVDFAIDEYGTAVANRNLDVYDVASSKGNVIGKIAMDTKVKVLRAYVNGDLPNSKHMIEYNGGIGYVNGKISNTNKYFNRVKVEGKIDPNNPPSDRVANMGEIPIRELDYVGIVDFKAIYGTKPVLTPYESDYYKITSIEYSTDVVKEKFSYVTATVTFIPTSPNYYKSVFADKIDADGGEVISLTKDKAVVRYTAFSGNGDTSDEIPSEVYRAADEIKGGYKNRGYAKAKVKSMGGNAKMYAYPFMGLKGEDPGEVVYIRDETVNYKIPELEETWYAVSKSPTDPVLSFMPAVFLENFEYLDSYMEGAPGDYRNTPFKFAGGKGTLEKPFLIETADQLNAMRYGLDMHYKLIADIDLSGWGNWVPIGATPAYGYMGGGWNKAEEGAFSFMGSLDGNGHVISGMKIIINEPTPYLTEGGNSRAFGLFGNLATVPDEHKIKNLGVVDFTIDVTYTDVKKPLDISAAAICGGMNCGMDIYNCYSKGGKINIDVHVNDAVAHLEVSGENPGGAPYTNMNIGGICSNGGGVFAGKTRKTYMHIEKCFNDSDIKVNINDAPHFLYVGGIIGMMDTTHIHECFNSGDITLPVNEGDDEDSWHEAQAAGICAYAAIPEIPNVYHKPPEASSFIQNCYNSGNITSRASAGIFLFSASDIHIENCYNVGKIKGNEKDKKDGYFTASETVSPMAAVYQFGTEFIRNCYADGNSVSGSVWKTSSSLGRKVLSAIPESNMPSGPYKFVVGKVGSFKDVKSNAWYAEAVKWAVSKKVTSGTSDTTFSPDQTCTRAQILTFMWRAAGCPKTNIENPFSDIKKSDYFYDAALWAYDYDMVTDSKFRPDTPCTRADTVTYLWKNINCPAFVYEGNFKDVSKNSDYASAVAWALYANVTSGTSDKEFSPNQTCTRAQIVTFLNRAFKK